MSLNAADSQQAICLLSHNFVNKLAVIIGSCQIIRERMQASALPDPECQRRVDLMERIAKGLADDVQHYRCQRVESDKMAMTG